MPTCPFFRWELAAGHTGQNQPQSQFCSDIHKNRAIHFCIRAGIIKSIERFCGYAGQKVSVQGADSIASIANTSKNRLSAVGAAKVEK